MYVFVYRGHLYIMVISWKYKPFEPKSNGDEDDDDNHDDDHKPTKDVRAAKKIQLKQL